jgi:hypothetical protein
VKVSSDSFTFVFKNGDLCQDTIPLEPDISPVVLHNGDDKKEDDHPYQATY